MPEHKPTLTERIDALETDIGPTDNPTRRAVLLVAAAHTTRNRNIWGGDRAITFWDRLPDRVRVACYRGPTLNHWWEAITRTLDCHALTRAEDRTAVAQALAQGDDRTVLDVLRTQAETVCLRVRLAQQPAKPHQEQLPT